MIDFIHSSFVVPLGMVLAISLVSLFYQPQKVETSQTPVITLEQRVLNQI